jgi:hypothetical protein
MPTLQGEINLRTELQTLLSDLAQLKATELARKELVPDLNFESGVVFFSSNRH